jgi:hypothetical protein
LREQKNLLFILPRGVRDNRGKKTSCLFCRGVSEQVEAKKLLDLLAMFLYTYYC